MGNSVEEARALVCERCWNDVVDTEAFEKVGRGEEFSYSCTEDQLIKSIQGENCSWCIFVRQGRQAPRASSRVKLSLNSNTRYTPTGNNLYRMHVINSRPFKFGLFTNSEDLAASQVTARRLQTDVSPQSTQQQMLNWFDDCDSHPCCPQQANLPLPTRVIDVRALRIVTTKGSTGRYAALSYCWGSRSQQTLLEKSNFESLSLDIDFEMLPQTIKDAILVTRSINVPYLWVDALCIIQDSKEDKSHEIVMMAQVYGNSSITIVASSAAGASEGFLQPRKPQKQRCTIPYRVSEGTFGQATLHTSLLDGRNDPINQRAWTLQEQLISKRSLIYASHTLQWRCAARTMNLGQSLHVYDSSSSMSPPIITKPSSFSISMSGLSTSPERAIVQWSRTVSDYSSRTATLLSDKLPAIAALAKEFDSVLGPGYHAGIWEHCFINQLLWVTESTKSYHEQMPYLAPSWSWACREGKIWFAADLLQNRTYACTVISARTTLQDEMVPYGEVAAGSLTVRGKLLPIWVDGNTEPACYYVFGINSHSDKFSLGSSPSESPPTRFKRLQSLGIHCLAEGDKASILPTSLVEIPAFDDLYTSNLGLVYYLPLVIKAPKTNKTHQLTGNTVWAPEHECEGLTLVPAGQDTFKRIGRFSHLCWSDVKGLPEEEITLV